MPHDSANNALASSNPMTSATLGPQAQVDEGAEERIARLDKTATLQGS
jgi:hypothetical protein